MRVLDVRDITDPRERGRVHGEAFRGLIAELAELRLGLTVDNGRFADEASVLSAAAAHLPVLGAFDAPLLAELEGVAEGAGLDAPRLVVLNHYTDLKDLDPVALGVAVGAPPKGDEEDCSAVYAQTPEGPLLGQTWDMHGSAQPYVCMLRVPGVDDGPGAWCLSIVGCLGMAGLNAAGVGVTINNLKSRDARVGVLWPALVRKALQRVSATEARDVILGAELGSGHHYLVADAERAFGIETSGAEKRLVFEGGDAFVHTNHCLDDEIDACTNANPTSTTHERYAALTAGIEARAVESRGDLWRRLGSHEGYPRSVCTHLASATDPHAMRTCGAVVMNLADRDAWAVSGCVHQAWPHWFDFDDDLELGGQ